MCFIFIYFFYVTALVSFKFDSYLKVTCYICRVLAERDFSSLFSDFWLFILLLAFFPFKFLTYFLFNIYVYLYLSNSIYLGVLPIFLPHERVGDLSLSIVGSWGAKGVGWEEVFLSRGDIVIRASVSSPPCCTCLPHSVNPLMFIYFVLSPFWVNVYLSFLSYFCLLLFLLNIISCFLYHS